MKLGKLIKKRDDQVANIPSARLQESNDGFHHRIAVAAYELYELRGRANGHDLDDWLQAEAIVNGRAD